MTDRVVWRTAQPLWSHVGASTLVDEPAVLRFAGDDFMDQFGSAVACGGGGLAPFVARHETWEQPVAGLHVADDGAPVKLYQPTHGRFYLVTASLVCRRYGHPDRAIDADERVGFVLRRLEPTGDGPVDVTTGTSFDEYGWDPSAGTSGAWVPATDAALAVGEERLPLFPVTTHCGENPRRLHAGLVPVSRREALVSAPRRTSLADVGVGGDPMAVLIDPRLRELEPLVVELQQLRSTGAGSPTTAVRRESLFYVAADLARWFAQHLPGQLTSASTALGLQRHFRTSPSTMTWRAALIAAAQQEPTARFAAGSPLPPVVDGMFRAQIRAAASQLVFGHDDVEDAAADAVAATQTPLFTAAVTALKAADALAAAAPPAGAAAEHEQEPEPVVTSPQGVYAVRFVYERPHCRPAQRQLLSHLSRPFRFAAFHDPEAPGRPIRIAMPVDTSPGGLRRFPKNVSVVLSSELRKQMQRVSKDTLHDGDIGEEPDGVGFGMLCQLSIPIITICALILLMIIVQLLNLVFFWVPLFKVCLPVPKGE